MAPGDLDGVHHIAAGPGDDDAERFNLVDAGVGRVQPARNAVEPDFPANSALELASKSVDHSNGSLVSQGVDWVERRGLRRRIEPEEDADSGGEAKGEKNGVRRNARRPGKRV